MDKLSMFKQSKDYKLMYKVLNTLFFTELRHTQLGILHTGDTNLSMCTDSSTNKELFKNAPPYMIITTSLKGGLYMSAGKTSNCNFKLTYIYVQLLTKPDEHYD